MRRWLPPLAALAAVTSFVSYFFDPVHGRERRARVRAWALAVWERSLRAAGKEVPAEPPPEVQDAVARLEEAMAAAAAAPPPPAAAPEGEPAPPSSPAEPETAAPAEDDLEPVPAVTLHEAPRASGTDFSEWNLGSRIAAFDAPSNRTPRRLLAAVAGAAALSLAVAVALVVWAVWPSSGRSTTTETQALVKDQAQAIALLSQPKVKRIPVLGTGGRLVLVYAPNGNAVLIASQVKPAPKGKKYEAWVIVGKKPTPAGLFAGGGASVVVPLGRIVPKGAIVAVTLERAGGVSMPTQKPLFAITRS
jgi:Anti-sigma-K factor rskA